MALGASTPRQNLDRRIGRDELTVIEVSRAYVAAQREYAALRVRSGGPAAYAQHFMSAAGQRNGLYWPIGPGEAESPLGRPRGYQI
jgi:hypothetical protein